MQNTLREVAKLDDIEDGEALGIEMDGLHIALYRLNGEIFATDNVCPHQFALLSDGYVDTQEACVECPLHQARFSIATGQVLCGPAKSCTQRFAARVEGDWLCVAVTPDLLPELAATTD